VVTRLLVALLVVGCQRPHAPSPSVRRIVSLAPSSTEIVYALGASARLVGVDQFSDFPPAARSLPRVGSDLSPSVERILALKPDLVLLSTSANTRELAADLRRLGVRVIVSSGDDLSEVFDAIVQIGSALDLDGRGLIAQLRARRDAVEKRVAGLPRPRTLVVVWTDPLSIAGGKSFVDGAIGSAGGDDVAADSAQPYPQYSVERLLARAPEVIVVGSHGDTPPLGPLLAHPSLPAVRDHRVYRIDQDLLFRPGPRLVDGIETLSRILHP
jgi:cobalamin transport system substrate-binding protein